MTHSVNYCRITRHQFTAIIFCFALFSFLSGFAQKDLIIDSLKKSAIGKHDTVKAEIYDGIAHKYRNIDLDSANHYALRSYQLATKANHITHKVDALVTIGLLARKAGDLSKALTNHNTALAIAQNSSIDTYLLCKIYNNLCQDYTEQGNYTAAIEYGHKALYLIEKTDDTLTVALINNNLADVFFYTAKYDKAIYHYRKALGYAIALNNRYGQGILYGNLGSVFYQTEQLDSAYAYFNKSLSISLELEDNDGAASTYQNIGSYFQKKHQNKEALPYFYKAEKLMLEQGMEPDLSTLYFNISTSYLESGDLSKAKQYAEKALVLANKINSYPLKESAHLSLSNINAKLNNIAASYFHYKQYISARDSIFNEENRNAQYKSEIEFDYIRKRDSDSLQHAINSKLHEISLEQEKSKTKAQLTYTYTASVGCLILLVLAMIIFKNYRQKQKANIIISSQKQEVELQKSIIEEHQKETIDSINYAKKIQYALLANLNLLNENLSEHFVLFKPKDIVSGDFYWATEHDDKLYLAVCDSTGHGVPGAFMSLLNIGFLNEAVKEKNILKPNEIFNYVRQRLIDSIGNDGQRDGMDAVLICIDKTIHEGNRGRVTYAAANNEPVLVKEKQIIELPKDKMPVGKGEKSNSFTLYEVDAEKGNYLYLYTDGFADQFGGPKGKKFKYKALNDLLVLNSDLPLYQQQQKLSDAFEDWKGKLDQVDDVCIIGLRF